MSEPTLEGLFDEIADWQTQFKHPSNIAPLTHMLEELEDELLGQGCDHNDLKELADLYILWVGAVVNARKDNEPVTREQISRVIDEKMAENRGRSWLPPDENGVVRHVKPFSPIPCEGTAVE